jgi:hypothetical protein
MGGAQRQAPVIVEIDDPVGRVRLTLDTVNKVAHKQELPEWQPQRVPRSVGMQASASLPPPAAGSTSGTQSSGVVASVVSSAAPVMAPRPGNMMPRLETASEDLGTQLIEGVAAKGTRRTTTWPAGSQGNDRPITSVNEMWMSDELKVMVLNKNNDPRSGEHTMKLVNLSRAEPDPSLFQAPPDYTVVEEKGEFTMKWGQQPQ